MPLKKAEAEKLINNKINSAELLNICRVFDIIIEINQSKGLEINMKRASGVLMHISSLWGDYSEGSFGENACEWVDFLAECGFSYWQTLPFCLPDEANSPYKSFSAFSINPYFIDLPLLCKAGLITKDELSLAKQNTPYACEFERLGNERLALLSKAADRMKNTEVIDEFMKCHKYTDNFCKYMALKAANNDLPWNEWTIDTPDPITLKMWRFSQFIAYTQWIAVKEYANKKGISIIGDIPIYVAWDSADVWASPEQFQLDERKNPSNVAGVPPDYFSADGQLWGNPLYDWDKMKNDGFSWWKDRMSFMLELFDGVRIDHFRGFESYYSIPANETTAKNGKWIKGPGMDLISAIKPLCDGKLIIAEDLGDITPQVIQLVEDSGFPGMRVLQFGFLDSADSPHMPHNYINNSVAYTGTHDNNTLLGYVWELDPGTRRRVFDYCGFGGEHLDDSYNHLLRTMFQSHAGLLMLPVQDLLLYGRDTRINKPGIAEGNWSYRVTKQQINTIYKEKFIHWNRLYSRMK
ncbi:MAG: 4-alpha-glucanotransferase [Ruminococcaceae bacterium]|nr:4-alpha-glucanotransferase [Oscillospiraceae bacterium]